MTARNITIDQLNEALATINRDRYAGNIVWKRGPEHTTKNTIRFTLTVLDSRKPGGRRSHTGRRISAACWHVHGHLFNECFRIAPDALIMPSGQRITKDHGNWEDRNIGSLYQPMYFSEACECTE